MKCSAGFEFIGSNCKLQQVLGISTFNGEQVYICNDVYRWNGEKIDYEGRIHGDILTESDMEEELSCQEYRLALIAEQKEEERRKQEEEERRQEELRIFGFCDGMSKMQAGKIQKILMKKYRYNGVVMARKDFIKKAVEEGAAVEEHFFDNYYNGERPRYWLQFPGVVGAYDITKTESDLFTYLKKQEEYLQ